MRTYNEVNDRLQKLREKDIQAYNNLSGMVTDLKKIYTGNMEKCTTEISNTLKNLDLYLDRAFQPKY